MKSLRKIWPVLLSLVVLALIGCGLFLTIRFSWRAFASLDKQIAAATVVASGTVLVSVITVVLGKQFEKKREIEQQHRIQKIEIYEAFMERMFKMLQLGTTKQSAKSARSVPIGEDDLTEFLAEFTRKLILWGGHPVIKQYVALRAFGLKPAPPDPRIILQFEAVLFAIRRDLGHSNRGLAEGDLVTLILKDPEKLSQLVGASGTTS